MSLALSVSLLLLRAIVGIIFMAHGYPKFFEKKSRSATIKFFKAVHVPLPGFFALLVGFIEFFGGLALVVGIATPIFAFLLSMIMVVAIALTGIDRSFKGGYELDLLLFVAGLVLFILGGGVFALERVLGM